MPTDNSSDRQMRFDVAALGAASRTSQGFLRVPAYLTRAGVLDYRRADGSTVRELRSPGDVFAAQSLASLRAAPVTDLHPSAMVSPSNVRELSIGRVSDDVRRDGEHVAAEVIIEPADAIARIESGDRRELSCGYTCRIDATPGVYEGQPYDQAQRDIRYNHVAIGPRGWGRAGRDVALRIDGGVEPQSDVFALRALDGLAASTIAAPQARTDSRDARADALEQVRSERDQLLGRIDALEAELGAARRAAAETQEGLERDAARDAAVHARADLLERARRVLGRSARLDGQTDRQMHEAVLARLDPAFRGNGQSDDYVRSRFDWVLERSEQGSSSLDRAREAATLTGTAARQDAGPAYRQPAWRQPLRSSSRGQ